MASREERFVGLGLRELHSSDLDPRDLAELLKTYARFDLTTRFRDILGGEVVEVLRRGRSFAPVLQPVEESEAAALRQAVQQAFAENSLGRANALDLKLLGGGRLTHVWMPGYAGPARMLPLWLEPGREPVKRRVLALAEAMPRLGQVSDFLRGVFETAARWDLPVISP